MGTFVVSILVHAVAATKAPQSIAPGETESPLIAYAECVHENIHRDRVGWAVNDALKQLTDQGVLPENCFVTVTFKHVDSPGDRR